MKWVFYWVVNRFIVINHVEIQNASIWSAKAQYSDHSEMWRWILIRLISKSSIVLRWLKKQAALCLATRRVCFFLCVSLWLIDPNRFLITDSKSEKRKSIIVFVLLRIDFLNWFENNLFLNRSDLLPPLNSPQEYRKHRRVKLMLHTILWLWFSSHEHVVDPEILTMCSTLLSSNPAPNLYKDEKIWKIISIFMILGCTVQVLIKLPESIDRKRWCSKRVCRVFCDLWFRVSSNDKSPSKIWMMDLRQYHRLLQSRW